MEVEEGEVVEEAEAEEVEEAVKVEVIPCTQAIPISTSLTPRRSAQSISLHFATISLRRLRIKQRPAATYP